MTPTSSADAPVAERLPTIDLPVGAAVPGQMLRGVLAAALVTLTGLAFARVATGTGPLATTLGFGTAAMLGVIVAVPAVAFARIPVTQMAVALAAIGLLLSAHGPFDPVIFAVLPVAHLALRTSAWCAVVPLRARIEVAALKDDARTSLLVQVAVQVVGVVVLLVAGYEALWMLGVAAAALLALAYLTIPRTWWR